MAQPKLHSPAEDTPLLEGDPEHGVLVRVEQPRPQAARRRRTSCCSLGCCCCVFLALVVLALIFIFVWIWFVFQVGFSGCPPNNPLCWPWKSSELDYKPVPHPNNVTFAVGFHFTAGYGYNHPNTQMTRVMIADIEQDSSYLLPQWHQCHSREA